MATIKKIVNLAAKFFDMAKAKGKAPKKAAPKGKGKPAAKKVAKPAKKVAPKAKKAAKPVKKAKPVAKKAVKAKPAPQKKIAAKVVAKKPVAKVKPVAKPKAVAKPVVKPQVKVEAPKPVAKPQPKVAAKPVVAKPQLPVVTKHETNNGAKPLYKTNMKKPEIEVNELNLRYSDEELKEFKDLIDKKLVSAREELKNLKEALDNHTESQAGNKAWNMEEGTDTSEMEYLMNQISRQHQYIRNLELAMVRIENKTYGICRVTGKLIPKERLRIVPHATLSLEAKMTRKSDDTSPGASLTAPPSDFSEGFED